ncbi:MAG: EamA family transporter [Pseudomonadota bacterium]
MTGKTSSAPYGEFVLLGVLAILWGSSYLFIKVAIAEIPPLTLIAIRVSIAAVFLACVLALTADRLPRDARSWRMLFVQSFFNSIAAWTLLAWGQQHIASGLASVLNSTSPLFVFFFTLLVTRHEVTDTLKLFGACLGLFGVILIVGIDALAGLGQQVAGQIAALTGAALYGCAAIYGRRFTDLSATAIATGTMLWASLVLVPASLIFERPWSLSPSWPAIVASCVLGLLCTGVALLIYFRLIKTIGSLGTASQAYLRAGVGVLLGALVLGERITPMVGLGLLAAIVGVAAINLPRRH